MSIRTVLLTACGIIAAALAIRAQSDNDALVPAVAIRASIAAAPTPTAPTASAAAAPSAAPAPSATGNVPIRHIVDTGQTSGGPQEPKYHVESSWVIAGYNDDEIIYSIIIANQDANVIRCTTLLSGYYLDNGTRHAISDRQSVTLFPGKQSSAGTWVGMDQASGASYKVTCRAMK